ncbi:VOC family protein [Herbaspirillum sp.]|uniref:VOC family protein n=1 Tax=Herbaspirillum sp. TaxID=1890675 RepID=UPI0031DA150A
MTQASLHTEPDHLVVTAPTLASGMAWVQQQLGVSMAPRIGGQHARLGTHNALLSLGPGFYLEVIAIDPEASAPARPRWFGMDEPGASATPGLAHWVARTDDIEAAVAASPIATGAITPMSRGALSWLITIAADGRLPCAGLMPSLIQWHSQPHPASALPDHGCRLLRLELHHPAPADLAAALAAVGIDDARVVLREARQSAIVAVLSTTQGERVLAG